MGFQGLLRDFKGFLVIFMDLKRFKGKGFLILRNFIGFKGFQGIRNNFVDF